MTCFVSTHDIVLAVLLFAAASLMLVGKIGMWLAERFGTRLALPIAALLYLTGAFGALAWWIVR